VVLETGGKADQGQSTTRCRAFRPPPSKSGLEPRLPKAPKVSKPAVQHAVVKPMMVAPKAKKPDVLP
jgi:hypothetical protein